MSILAEYLANDVLSVCSAKKWVDFQESGGRWRNDETRGCFSLPGVSNVSFRLCFDTVGWLTGRISGPRSGGGRGGPSVDPWHFW